MLSPEKRTPRDRANGAEGVLSSRSPTGGRDTRRRAQKAANGKLGLPGASGSYLRLAERYRGPFLGWWGGVQL